MGGGQEPPDKKQELMCEVCEHAHSRHIPGGCLGCFVDEQCPQFTGHYSRHPKEPPTSDKQELIEQLEKIAGYELGEGNWNEGFGKIADFILASERLPTKMSATLDTEELEKRVKDIVMRIFHRGELEANKNIGVRDGGPVMAKQFFAYQLLNLLTQHTQVAVEEAELKTEIKVHNEYWNSEYAVEEAGGIGLLALERKEQAEAKLEQLEQRKKDKS